MKRLIFLFLIFSRFTANAGMESSFLDFGFGIPFDLSIKNPDDTIAYYEGYAIKPQFHYNFGRDRRNFSYGFTFGYKYLSLDNTNDSTIKESATHKGFGAGVFMKASSLYIGANYSLMKAKHQTSGALNSLSDYDYNAMTGEVSFTIPYGDTLEIGPGYTYTSATLVKEETGLSENVPYREQTLWLRLLVFFNGF